MKGNSAQGAPSPSRPAEVLLAIKPDCNMEIRADPLRNLWNIADPGGVES